MCTGHNTDRSHTSATSVVTVQPLDSVHALHQTIVHLRDALDAANHEIGTLKKQITINDDIELGKQYRVQQRQEPCHHHSNQSIDTAASPIESSDRQPRVVQVQRKPSSSATYTITTTTIQSTANDNNEQAHSTNDPHDERQSLNRDKHKTHKSSVRTSDSRGGEPSGVESTETVSSKQSHKMASKIDVKIKLTSNFQVDGSESSTEATTDTASGERNEFCYCFFSKEKLF